ncbi:MAG TPA: aminotransferase class V-fold PLP-dependent enzyme, partial [Casimicrobiaceae bacterium]
MKMDAEVIRAASPPRLDVAALRRDFPILAERVNGKPLVYLDNAATTQKPASVIDALDAYYRHENANVHRGVHTLSQRATDDYEAARARIAGFIGGVATEEVIYTSGTTGGLNLVAQSYGRNVLRPGDDVVISALEHHSNIVPWQLVCAQTGASLKVVPVNDAGEIEMDAYERLLGPRTKIVAFTHVSNALGTITPIERV